MNLLPKEITRAAKRVMWTNAAMLVLMLLISLYLTWSLKSHQSRSVIHDQATIHVTDARYNTVQIQQFLTDYSLTGEKDSLAEAEAARDASLAALRELGKLLPDMAQPVSAMEHDTQALFQAGLAMANAYLTQSKEAGDAMMLGPGGFDETSARLADAINAKHNEIQQAQLDEDETTSTLVLINQVLLAALAFLVATTLIYLLRAMIRNVLDQLRGEPAYADQIVKQLSSGQLNGLIQVAPGDNTSLIANLRTLQAELQGNAARALENIRIRYALDSVTSNVRIADDEGTILYANPAFLQTLRGIEAPLRSKRPDFSVDRFIGGSIGVLYDNPQEAVAQLRQSTGTRETELRLCDRQFRVITSLITDDCGRRMGTVGQWIDHTVELAAQSEVNHLVGLASKGDLSARINLSSLEGFYRELGDNINMLISTTERGLTEVANVMRSLSQGELTKRIQGD